MNDADPDWLERVWEEREDRVYKRLFGAVSNGIFTLDADLFHTTFGQKSIDPRWLFYGVFELPPHSDRSSWLYVTSGMSNAWDDPRPDPKGPSGLGCEFVLETKEKAAWAIRRLQQAMAFQILIAVGKLPERGADGLLAPFDRIPLRGSITTEPSEITWLMLAPPSGYESELRLESGFVKLNALVGITEAEAAFARERGGEALLTILIDKGGFPCTDPRRRSTV